MHAVVSEFAPPVPCACGETRVRREDSYVLVQSEGALKPVYSNSKFVCISCGKGRFEKRIAT